MSAAHGSVEKTGSLAHRHHLLSHLVWLVESQENMSIHRPGDRRPDLTRSRSTDVKDAVLDDLAGLEISLGDVGVAAELRHVTEPHASREVRQGRGGLAAAAVLAQESEGTANGLKELDLDLFESGTEELGLASHVKSSLLDRLEA